jgi:phage baseplate assembly protein gpV
MTGADDRALEDLIERQRARFYGKYRGIVHDIDAATMRIKAIVPSVFGENPTGWCMPCVPYAGPNRGFGFLPEKNSGVWIEFEGGDVSYPLWVGGYWREGEFPSDAAEHVKVIMTGDHKLEFDDDQGTITLTDNNSNSVKLDSSGITLKNGETVSVVVSSSSVSVNDGALEVQA